MTILDALGMIWRKDKPSFLADLSNQERAVLTCLLMHGDNPSNCFPSITTICTETTLSKSSVLRALEGLAKKKLIRRHKSPPPQRTAYTVSLGNGSTQTPSETVSGGHPTVPQGHRMVSDRHLDSATQTPEVVKRSAKKESKEVRRRARVFSKDEQQQRPSGGENGRATSNGNQPLTPAERRAFNAPIVAARTPPPTGASRDEQKAWLARQKQLDAEMEAALYPNGNGGLGSNLGTHTWEE